MNANITPSIGRAALRTVHKDTGFQGYEPNVRKLYQPKKSLASKN